MTGQPGLSFAELLRQLRAEARLTQEELAEAAGLSSGSVSSLERGINRTAHKDTAVLLAGALGLAGPAGELFVAAARGRAPAADVLAAIESATTAPDLVAGSPYRGLSVFAEQDAGLFFGREAATVEVLDRMSRLLGGAGLLVVSGVSGAGKSSLLRAGVLPRLRAAGLPAVPGAARWPRVVLTPTRAPLDELALRAAVLAGADAAAVRRGLDTAPAWFALTARQAALARPPGQAGDADGGGRDQPGQRRVVLVVDQFEELFTLCAEEGQRRAFITALHAAATAGHGPDRAPAALVVLGVRADFEARCADYPQLAGPVQDRYLVTAMTERQLRMAITEPAKKAGAKVDDGLADVLLAEVRTGQPKAFGAGALPLLSHALDQAWRHRTGQAVTLADYDRAGGIDGAVAASAQRVYDRLTPAQQAVARQVFLRLTATSPEGADTADRATRAELTEGRSPAEAQDVEAVLEAFAAERLLTLAADTVELSHEVLLTAWPLLRDTWLADTHSDRIVRTRLHTTAAEWDHHARDPSYLYAGTLLQAATDTAARITADPARHPPLSQTETDFLHASDHARHRRTRRRQAVVAGLLALTLAAVTAAGIAAHNAAAAARNAAAASRQHAIALSRQLTVESLAVNPAEPVIARRLAVAAWRVFPTSQAASVMATLLAGQQQNGILPADQSVVWGVAFSPRGTLLASANGDGTVQLWNPATGQPAGEPLVASTRRSVNGVAFSPGGQLLASADADGTVRLWNPATGQLVRALQATSSYGGGVRGVAFSPSGQLLASADSDGTVRLWNPATGQPVRILQAASSAQGAVEGVAFSPDGRLLASAGGAVRLWDPSTGRLVRVLHAVSGAVAFSPSGNLLASADDGTVRLWNPATGQPGRILHDTSSAQGVFGVAFSSDGTLLASADGDGTVRLWDHATGQLVHILHATSSAQAVFGVAFSPGGQLLAGASGDGTVRLWNPATGQPPDAPSFGVAPQLAGVFGMAFSPSGNLLASPNAGGTVRLWTPATGQPGRILHTSSRAQGVFGVAFSPTGNLLASADADGTVRLWNPATGQLVRVLHADTLTQGGVFGVAFSSSGQLLASADADGTVRLWNPSTGQLVHVLHATSSAQSVLGVAFSSSGQLLASVGGDGMLRLWRPSTGQLVRVLHAPSSAHGVLGVAFSPSGQLLASAGGDGTVRLWTAATGRLVRVLHATSSAYGVLGVAFSPSGQLLASAGGDGTVRLWNPATGHPVGAPIPAATTFQVGVAAVAFSPNGNLLASANIDGAVRLWTVSAFTNPYGTLCDDAGAPTRQEWKQYAGSEPQPSVCI